MLARCATYVLHGVEARRVTVECDVRPGLPSFTVIGLTDSANRELRETVRAAIPQQRLSVPGMPRHGQHRARVAAAAVGRHLARGRGGRSGRRRGDPRRSGR
jgi:hypothetical protein